MNDHTPLRAVHRLAVLGRRFFGDLPKLFQVGRGSRIANDTDRNHTRTVFARHLHTSRGLRGRYRNGHVGFGKRP